MALSNDLKHLVVSWEGNDEGRIHCPHPGHEDHTPSAYINFQKEVWFCHGCGNSGQAQDLVGKQPIPRSVATQYQDRLMDRGHEPQRQYLESDRGISPQAMIEYLIGWDEKSHRFTIPVIDEEDKIRNIRYYKPPDNRWFQSIRRENEAKIYNTKGFGERRLFGVKMLPKVDTAVVTEGEWDAIVARENRWRMPFAAVCGTGGAKSFNKEWARHFKDKTVYIVYDCDDEGDEGARRVANILLPVARSVHIVDLDLWDSEDVTDFFVVHGMSAWNFETILLDTPPIEVPSAPSKDEVSGEAIPARLHDTFDGDLVGQPLEVRAVVSGRKMPPHLPPKDVSAVCDMAWSEKKCPTCPMFLRGGEMEWEFAANDRDLLSFIDVSMSQSKMECKRVFGIPKNCPNVEFTYEACHSLQRLVLGPNPEERREGGDSRSRLVYASGYKDHRSLNVRVVGSPEVDPRNLKNMFFSWQVEDDDSSIDHFPVDEETMDLLSVFQPEEDQLPLDKLYEIAYDLGNNVTFIYGREELQIAFDLVIHSALYVPFKGKDIKGTVECIAVGDTRTGKSELATRALNHYGVGKVIDCETTTTAGLIGAVKQHQGNEWSLEWGVLPLNDRRAVVLDEAGGLPDAAANQLSSVRSSGVAEINKVESGETSARVRLFWIANPVDGGWLGRALYGGVQEIPRLVPHAEDVARFDLALAVSANDVPLNVIHGSGSGMPHIHTDKACHSLIRWAWSRKPEQIIWEEGAIETIFACSRWLLDHYVTDPPLIQQNVHEKIARLAVAVAMRLFSTEDGEKVLVTKGHVKAAVRFMDNVYRDPVFGYYEMSKREFEEEKVAKNKEQHVRRELITQPTLRYFLLRCANTTGRFRSEDMRDYLGYDNETVNWLTNMLYSAYMIEKESSTAYVKPRLNELLREMEKELG